MAKKETFTPIWNYEETEDSGNKTNLKAAGVQDPAPSMFSNRTNTSDAGRSIDDGSGDSRSPRPKAQKMFEEYKPKTAEEEKKRKMLNTLMAAIVILLMLVLIVAIVVSRFHRIGL